MSGMVFDDSSVLSFHPVDGWRAVYVGNGSLDAAERGSLVLVVVGWAVVVTHRSDWVVNTDMAPVVVQDGVVTLLDRETDYELAPIAELSE